MLFLYVQCCIYLFIAVFNMPSSVRRCLHHVFICSVLFSPCLHLFNAISILLFICTVLSSSCLHMFSVVFILSLFLHSCLHTVSISSVLSSSVFICSVLPSSCIHRFSAFFILSSYVQCCLHPSLHPDCRLLLQDPPHSLHQGTSKREEKVKSATVSLNFQPTSIQ